MTKHGLLQFLAPAIAGLWIGGAILTPARTVLARSHDSEINDSSGGDEGPDDSSSRDHRSRSREQAVGVSGRWSGTIVDNTLGAGSFDLSISQHKQKLNGGFEISPPQGAGEDLSGSLSGKATSNSIAFTLKPSRIKGCRIFGTSTAVSSSEIKGSYATANCGNSLTKGTFDVNLEHP